MKLLLHRRRGHEMARFRAKTIIVLLPNRRPFSFVNKDEKVSDVFTPLSHNLSLPLQYTGRSGANSNMS